MIHNKKSPEVILIPGIWNDVKHMYFLGSNLEKKGCRVRYFPYDTTGTQRFEQLGEQLAADIEKSETIPYIVAFSMGGLVARTALSLCHSRAAGAAFLNSPHNGSQLAWCLPFLEGVRQMRPGSAFLQKLHAAPIPCPTLAMWCPADLMVVPGSSARLPGATRTITCTVPMHVWPLISQRIHRVVSRFIWRCEALLTSDEHVQSSPAAPSSAQSLPIP